MEGDEVFGQRHFSTGIEPAAQDNPEPQTPWTEPMYSNRQSPFAVSLLSMFHNAPNEVFAETSGQWVDVVPAGSWAVCQ
jgi:hypothetical protein